MSAPEIEALASPPTSTPWVPLWPVAPVSLGELAYGEITAPVTCAGLSNEASATTVVTAPAITVDGATPIVIEVFIPGFSFTDSPNSEGFLLDGSTSLGRVWAYPSVKVNTAVTNSYIRITRRLTPAAGAHTYSFRAGVSSGAGVVMYAGPGGAAQWVPAFIRVSLAAPISTAPAGALLPVQYGTSLPGSPVDGQEAILVDSLTNPSYSWRFRYHAASTSPYKWEFVGGAPLYSVVDALEYGTTAWGYLATFGPSAVIPRNGEYQVSYGYSGNNVNNDGTNYMALAIDGTLQGGNAIAGGTSYGGMQFTPAVTRKFVINAAQTVAAQYYASGGWFQCRWLSVVPIRVA